MAKTDSDGNYFCTLTYHRYISISGSNHNSSILSLDLVDISLPYLLDVTKVESILLIYEHQPILLQADKSKIARVISNLLRNAIKFTSEGTITISVKNTRLIKMRKIGSILM